MTNNKVLFLLPYPLHRAPSQRFRVENLLYLLDEKGIDYRLAPFMSEKVWHILYKNGSIFQKAWGVFGSYIRRKILVIFEAHQYDIIFIHREAAPLGPPIFEWWLSKVWRKKIVYDFDDAIWIPNTSAENKIAALVKSFWKVKYICKWSYKISAGNDYLCNYAVQSGAKNVVKVPTVVDTLKRYNQVKNHHSKKVVVGWTGSHSTLKFLDMVVPIITKLQDEIDFEFLVIADKKPELPIKNWRFCPWNEQSEISDLLKIDIGIMPLKDDAWSEGKCGFKLIQYLALGIPAIAHPVGVNKQIIQHNQNGFLAKNDQEWEQYLRILLLDFELRANMGIAGIQKINNKYSVEAIKSNFLGLFE